MKTVFTEGDPGQQIPATIVSATFLNAMQEHRHDGGNADGSCPRIPSGENLLIGSDFSRNPFQRGTESLVITESGTFIADRFRVEFDAAPTLTRDIVDMTVGGKVLGITVRKAIKLTVTAKGGASYIRVGQRIENVDCVTDANSVVSSGIQGNKALTVPIRLVQHFGSGGAPSGDVVSAGIQQLAVTAVLQELYADVAVPAITGKAYGTTANTDYLELQYDLSALATGDYVIIPVAKFEEAVYPSLCKYFDKEEVLKTCQPFLFKLDGGVNAFLVDGTMESAIQFSGLIRLPTMRIPPQLLIGAAADGYEVRFPGTAIECSAPLDITTIAPPTRTTAVICATVASNLIQFHPATLRSKTSAGFLLFSSEFD